MSVTATFTADFSSFQDAVNKAQVSLKGFQSDSEKVGDSLSRMVDRFSGRKLLEEGAQINKLFQTTGDIALLTDRELQQLSGHAAEIVEKMERLGVNVPQGLQRVADQTVKTTAVTGDLHSALGRFDGVLAAVGLNIGTEVRALTEMSSAVGKTVSEFGFLATAGIAAGAAIGAFGLTRALLDAVGVSEKLDKAVEKAWTSLKIFADVAGETAGAKQDVINRAIEHGADAMITYTEAIKFNNEWSRKHTLGLETSASVIAAWNTEIENVRKKGDFAQLTADIESQVFSTEKLKVRYNLSGEALEFLKNQMKGASEDAKSLNDDVHKLFETWAAGDKIMEEFAIKSHKLAMDLLREETTERQKALAERNKTVLDGFNQIQTLEHQNADFIQKQTLSTTDYQILKIREWEQATIDAFKGTEQQLAAFTEAVRTRAQQQVAALTEVANIVTLIGGGTSLLRPDTQSRIQAGPVGGGGFSLGPAFSLSTRAGGGPVSAGRTYLVGERGPELFQPGASGSILAGGGGGIVVNATFNWPIMNDPRSMDEVARRLGDAVAARMRNTGSRMSAGA